MNQWPAIMKVLTEPVPAFSAMTSLLSTWEMLWDNRPAATKDLMPWNPISDVSIIRTIINTCSRWQQGQTDLQISDLPIDGVLSLPHRQPGEFRKNLFLKA